VRGRCDGKYGEISKLLLENGADINTLNNSGDNLLITADLCKDGDTMIMVDGHYIRSLPNEYGDRSEVLERLVRSGINLDAKGTDDIKFINRLSSREINFLEETIGGLNIKG